MLSILRNTSTITFYGFCHHTHLLNFKKFDKPSANTLMIESPSITLMGAKTMYFVVKDFLLLILYLVQSTSISSNLTPHLLTCTTVGAPLTTEHGEWRGVTFLQVRWLYHTTAIASLSYFDLQLPTHCKQQQKIWQKLNIWWWTKWTECMIRLWRSCH